MKQVFVYQCRYLQLFIRISSGIIFFSIVRLNRNSTQLIFQFRDNESSICEQNASYNNPLYQVIIFEPDVL